MDASTVSELKAQLALASERLQKSEERGIAGQLALEVMHEIRNPLEALGHLIYLTLEEAQDAAQVIQNMHAAEEQMACVREIASHSLGFATATHLPQLVDLVGVGEAAIRLHQRKMEAKQLHLVKNLPETLMARVHSGQMLQVISNVIVNAVDALSPEGTLNIRLRKRGEQIEVVIADNGHGIPKELAARIFEPFFSTKEERGNGLGLALSKTILERHKGSIRVRSSVRPGKSGTIFRISLPA